MHHSAISCRFWPPYSITRYPNQHQKYLVTPSRSGRLRSKLNYRKLWVTRFYARPAAYPISLEASYLACELSDRKYCNKHCQFEHRGKAKPSRISKESSQEDEGEDKVKLDITPEDELRRKRNVGKDWWCKNRRIQGKSLCQEHYLISLYKSRVSASMKQE
ncbi:hypothetical protein NE237_020163 [Protea cynaroides]|uniref:WRC domain-containing protein n=1 Tax=Protea cynaroides TaxID=273540 RepID=A0A9Q0H644_9MAGN|nr:hypothetical protein NE237_020163 [Protea cynaroides]